ncbi:hypothetical protein [Pseudooceanicola sp.]|uniref:hypothetical protein n=1 Tax=Pseudooceanicola sp. TaxID=1914328 RepID=UPI0035C74C76
MEHIFEKLPRLHILSEEMGQPYQTVAAWKSRGSIPAKHDLMLVEISLRHGKGLSLDELAKARAAPPASAAWPSSSATGRIGRSNMAGPTARSLPPPASRR